jgi:hypothetical protein
MGDVDLSELTSQLNQGYDVPDDVMESILNRDVRAIALIAIGLGWRVGKAKGINLTAEDGTAVQLPTNAGLNFKVFRSRIRTVVRHGVIRTRLPFTEWVEQCIVITKLEHSHANLVREAVAAITSEQHWQNVGGGVLEKDDIVVTHGKPTRSEANRPDVADSPAPDHITREEPWSAHGRVRSGGSETYPSDAVMERVWSSGKHDYICRWPDCDYVSDIPRSTAAHYGSHVRGQGKAPQPEADGIDPAWAPRQTARITRLRRELDGALLAALAAGLDLRTPEFSHFLAQWIIDHRIESAGGDVDGGEDEGPLSTEQILDKISALADRGRSKILREQLDTLNALLDESEGARRKAEGNLHALRDLLNEEEN